MARARRDRPNSSSNSDEVLLKALPVVVAVAFLPTIAYNQGGGDHPTWNPLALFISLGFGKTTWPGGATSVLILELLLLAVAFVGGWWILRKIGVLEKVKDKRSEIRIDKLADTMVDPREVDETNVKHLAETTERLAPAIPRDHPGYLGIPLGETVVGKRDLRLPWEFVCLAYAGARMGKSAGLAIPAICHAPGATIVASNRGDVYSHTVGLRRKSGRVWLFDLQGVTTGDRRQRATFWFNPLRNVTDLPSAAAVCGYFISAATDANAKVDAYFDGNARDLFASYMLAASLAGGDIRHVVEWLTNTQSQIPPAILKQYGYPDLAKTMRGKQSVNAKQRDGFYDMARRFLAPLDEPRYAEAVLPNQRTIIGTDPDGNITFAPGDVVHDLPEFIAEEFVARTDTMYAMSKDGPGSSSAISSALVGQILNSAEEYSEQQESERMPIPMTAVLDEAANICKLEDLPRWYSHFGGRGIILITFLQSPSQGEKVWGREAFDAMVDACSVTWYGGNVKDDAYISGLVDAIGTHYVESESRNRGAGLFASGQSTVSSSWQKESIFEKRDLKALPKTRAIVTIGGSSPILVRKAFWGGSPFADEIRQSKKDSKLTTTLEQQKALPLGMSDRPATAVDVEPDPEVVVDTAAPQLVADRTPDVGVSSSRVDALFDSEFLGKD